MKKFTFIIAMLYFFDCYPQANRLSEQPKPLIEYHYVINNLRLRSEIDFLDFGLKQKEVLSMDTLLVRDSTMNSGLPIRIYRIVTTTNKPIVLNGEIFLRSSEKKDRLASISPLLINSIQCLSRRNLFKIYKIKTSSGGVVINTK